MSQSSERARQLLAQIDDLIESPDLPVQKIDIVREREPVPPNVVLAHLDVRKGSNGPELIARIGTHVGFYNFAEHEPRSIGSLTYQGQEKFNAETPIHEGPFVLVNTMHRGLYGISVDTGELIHGAKSQNLGTIQTSQLDFSTLASLKLRIGDPISFAQKYDEDDEENDDTDLHIIRSGPVTDILVCSTLVRVNFSDGTFFAEQIDNGLYVPRQTLEDEINLTPRQVNELFLTSEVDDMYRNFSTQIRGKTATSDALSDAQFIARRNAYNKRLDLAQDYLTKLRMQVK